MSSNVETLVGLIGNPESYQQARAELAPVQIAAANERFKELVGKIPLLRNRASEGGIGTVSKAADLVPLLFAHTAYKSYPESWIADNQWQRMGRWLETVSAHPVGALEVGDVTDLDEWIQRLESVGHYVTCSTGTTGKPALISCSKTDLERSGRIAISAFTWATGVEPTGDFKMMGVGGVSKAARMSAISDAMIGAFSTPELAYMPGGIEITIGMISRMIALRRRVTDGSATPEEIESFEQVSKMRAMVMENMQSQTIENYIDSRQHKLLIGGMWGLLYPIAKGVRDKGLGGKDFHPDNAMLIAGGLKGATLPPDFKEVILETFNVQPHRLQQVYAMQEMNAQFPRCSAGRYHIPAWVMLLLLNETGEQLLDVSGDEDVEGRAAFLDFSIEGRWGGVISGDKVSANFGKCRCGHHGPTVGPDIVRYSDLQSGDKLACSGTTEAYIRGAT